MNGTNNVFTGNYYRITVLTERLVRLEYSKNGIFEDKLSEFALNRSFIVPRLEVNDDSKYLTIKTAYFSLTYKKDAPFKGSNLVPTSNLKVELLAYEKSWYYGHPEVRNYGGIKTSLSSNVAPVKGLYSIDGFCSFDDSKTKVISSNGLFEDREEKDNIDLYLFMYGDDYTKALNDYFNLTGRPIFLPKYAFGIWWSRDYQYSEKDVFDLVRKFDEKDIPLSVILLDKYWHERTSDDGKVIGSNYSFNEEMYPNYNMLVSELSRLNVKLGLNLYFEDGVNSFDDDTLIPYNVFDVDFVKFIIKLVVKYTDSNIDIFWLDDRKKTQSVGMIDKYLNLDNPNSNNRRIVVSRASRIAPHRDTIVYTGRAKVGYETLRYLPFYTIRAANIGVSWISHDIAGFYGGIEDDELYIRSVQLGVFSPIFRFHGGNSKYYKKEPWNRSISTYHIVKDFLKLRMRLIPYIYSEAFVYVENAIPLVRPLYYTCKEIYDDPVYANEFYFGSQILVSPIVTKRDYLIKRVIHKFFLPEGFWYDLKSGKKYIGNLNHVGIYKKEEYPVFVKAGGILPMNYSKNMYNVDELNIMIFPGASNSYDLYEDDGKTNNYKRGKNCITTIKYDFSNSEIDIKVTKKSGEFGVIPNYRKYVFTLRNTAQPTSIVCMQNGSSINYEYVCHNNDLIITLYRVDTQVDLDISIVGSLLEISMLKKVEEEISQTIGDLPIETPLKERISLIISSDKELKTKRIEIIRLKKFIPKEYFALILKLLEYMNEE